MATVTARRAHVVTAPQPAGRCLRGGSLPPWRVASRGVTGAPCAAPGPGWSPRLWAKFTHGQQSGRRRGLPGSPRREVGRGNWPPKGTLSEEKRQHGRNRWPGSKTAATRVFHSHRGRGEGDLLTEVSKVALSSRTETPEAAKPPQTRHTKELTALETSHDVERVKDTVLEAGCILEVFQGRERRPPRSEGCDEQQKPAPSPYPPCGLQPGREAPEFSLLLLCFPGVAVLQVPSGFLLF